MDLFRKFFLYFLEVKPVEPQSSSKFHDSVEDEYRMRIPKNAKPLIEPLNIKRKTGLSGKVLLSIPTVEEVSRLYL